MVSYGLVLCCAPACTAYYGIRVSIMSSDVSISSSSAWILVSTSSAPRQHLVSTSAPRPETPESMDLGVCTLESPLLAPSDAPKPLESGSTPPKGVSKGVPLLEDPILGTLRCSKTPRIGINSPKRGPQKEWFQTPKSSVWTQTPCAS